MLTYDFPRGTVQIHFVLSPHVQTSEPVYIHFVHRRKVNIKDETRVLLDPRQPAGELVQKLQLLTHLRTDSDGVSVLLKGEDGAETQALIPTTSAFSEDAYCDASMCLGVEIPFTSARFGPLRAREEPYALGLSLTIEGEAFRRLIAVLPNGKEISRFLYSIDGPKVIARDIEPLDLRGTPPEIREPFHNALVRGIQNREIKIETYDIVTCDEPHDFSDYVRLLANVQECRHNAPMFLAGRKYLVNSWHSERTDFLIQRVSFSTA